MTLEVARALAEQLAQEQLKTLAVWRMLRWPVGVYGIAEPIRLPSEALVAEVFQAKAQGSLF